MSDQPLWQRFQPIQLQLVIATLILILGSTGLVGGLYFLFAQTDQSDTVVFSSQSSPDSSTDSAQLASEILVDVSGAVKQAGVYKLTDQDRIRDAVQAAGGFHEQADSQYVAKHLNLAEPIQDGQKIYIPFIDEHSNSHTASSVPSSSHDLISINNATATELQTLEGIGNVRAQKIIDNRPYQKVEELVTRKVLSENQLAKIQAQIGL